jgi:hypothetical protein
MPATALLPDNPAHPASDASPATNRIAAAALLAMSVLTVALAFVVTPAPLGVGTHEQLGFPPCLFHLFTGLPCPFCGMTTAFAHMARGQVLDALRCQPLGPFLFLAMFPLATVSTRALIAGRWQLPAVLTSSRAVRAFIIAVVFAWAINIVHTLIALR